MSIDLAQLRAAVAGDRAATAAILAAVRSAVVAYSRPRLRGSWLTPDDIAQDVCILLLRALPTYVPTCAEAFMGFVYRTTHNRITDTYRAAARRPALSDLEVPEQASRVPGPEQHATYRDEAARLLRQVPPRQRLVLLMRLVADQPTSDVGTALSLKPAAVRLAQHRAVQTLRRNAR